jgi:hypothetical protein
MRKLGGCFSPSNMVLLIRHMILFMGRTRVCDRCYQRYGCRRGRLQGGSSVIEVHANTSVSGL